MTAYQQAQLAYADMMLRTFLEAQPQQSHNYLYLGAELTRPCKVGSSLTIVFKSSQFLQAIGNLS
jgi:hypothetical protein